LRHLHPYKKEAGPKPHFFQLQLHLQGNYTNSCGNVQAQYEPAGQRAHSFSTRIGQLAEGN
jgi:hypothetical protein